MDGGQQSRGQRIVAGIKGEVFELVRIQRTRSFLDAAAYPHLLLLLLLLDYIEIAFMMELILTR